MEEAAAPRRAAAKVPRNAPDDLKAARLAEIKAAKELRKQEVANAVKLAHAQARKRIEAAESTFRQQTEHRNSDYREQVKRGEFPPECTVSHLFEARTGGHCDETRFDELFQFLEQVPRERSTWELREERLPLRIRDLLDEAVTRAGRACKQVHFRHLGATTHLRADRCWRVPHATRASAVESALTTAAEGGLAVICVCQPSAQDLCAKIRKKGLPAARVTVLFDECDTRKLSKATSADSSEPEQPIPRTQVGVDTLFDMAKRLRLDDDGLVPRAEAARNTIWGDGEEQQPAQSMEDRTLCTALKETQQLGRAVTEAYLAQGTHGATVQQWKRLHAAGEWPHPPRLTQQLYLDAVDAASANRTLCQASGGAGKTLLMMVLARRDLQRALREHRGHLVVLVLHRKKIGRDMENPSKDSVGLSKCFFDLPVAIHAIGDCKQRERRSDKAARAEASLSLLEHILRVADSVHAFSATPEEDDAFYAQHGFQRFEADSQFTTVMAETVPVLPKALVYQSDIWEVLGRDVVEAAAATAEAFSEKDAKRRQEQDRAAQSPTPRSKDGAYTEVREFAHSVIMTRSSAREEEAPGWSTAEMVDECMRSHTLLESLRTARGGSSSAHETLAEARTPTDAEGEEVLDEGGATDAAMRRRTSRYVSHIFFLMHKDGLLTEMKKSADGLRSYREVAKGLGKDDDDVAARAAIAQVSMYLVNAQHMTRRGSPVEKSWIFVSNNLRAEIYRQIFELLGNTPSGVAALDRLSQHLHGESYAVPDDGLSVVVASTARGPAAGQAQKMVDKLVSEMNENTQDGKHRVCLCSMYLDRGMNLPSLQAVGTMGRVGCTVARLMQIIFRCNRTAPRKDSAHLIIPYGRLDAAQAVTASLGLVRQHENMEEAARRATMSPSSLHSGIDKRTATLDGGCKLSKEDYALIMASRHESEGCSPPRVQWSDVDAVVVQRGPLQGAPEGHAQGGCTEWTLLLSSEAKKPASTRHGGQRWLHFRLKRHVQGEDGSLSRETGGYDLVLNAAQMEHFPDGHYARADCEELLKEVRRQVDYNKVTPSAPTPGRSATIEDAEEDFLRFVQRHRKRGARVALQPNQRETADNYLSAISTYMKTNSLGQFRRDSELAKKMCDDTKGIGGVLCTALAQFYDWTVDRKQKRLRPAGDVQAPEAKRPRARRAAPQETYCLADYLNFLQSLKGITDGTKGEYANTVRKLFRNPQMATQMTGFPDCAPLANGFLDTLEAKDIQVISENVCALAAALPNRHAIRSQSKDVSRLAAVLSSRWTQFVASGPSSSRMDAAAE